ncbi:aminotransferase-like domain-containing protein, partial [Candidatus Entotheonella palauensis]|uniref:aminotransferase-like domain-containing protein n=1 Tax=Candidatus Entotheonella palauensis TaxID=93172 RepID=UPI001177BFDF
MARQPYLQINVNKHNAGRSLSMAQIVSAVKEQITLEHVAPGCRLPPVRVLAHQLGMSKTTIQLAYDELVAQGLLESTERVGLFVASDPKPVPVAPETLVVPPPCMALPATAPPAPARPPTEGMLNLGSVFIDPALLPHEKLSACFRSVVKQPQAYAAYHDQGFPPLRQAIAERLQARGIDASAEDIVITAGSQQALDLVCRVLKQKRIATENPAYSHGKALFEMNGMETLPLPLDPFCGIDPDVWERQLATSPALLYLTTNYHNPTGYSYTTSELQQILGWSQQYGFGILEDDWGADMLSFS